MHGGDGNHSDGREGRWPVGLIDPLEPVTDSSDSDEFPILVTIRCAHDASGQEPNEVTFVPGPGLGEDRGAVHVTLVGLQGPEGRT